MVTGIPIKVGSIRFDPIMFPLFPRGEVNKVLGKKTGLLHLWQEVHEPPLSYTLDLEKRGLHPKTKNGINYEKATPAVTLFVSRSGKGGETIYTMNIQNSKGENLLDANIEVLLKDILKEIENARLPFQESIEKRMFIDFQEKMGVSHKNSVRKTPEATTEENKAVDSAIIKSFKQKMDYFIKTHDNFYLYLHEALSKADAQNTAEFIKGRDVKVLNYITHGKS